MKQRAKRFASSHFSRLSLSIIVFEAAVILGLIYFFVPVGQLLKSLSGLAGTVLSVLVAIRVTVWFYREIRSLLNGKSSTEGGQLEVEGSGSRPIESALQTTNERFDEEVSSITDWMRIDENGEITLVPDEDISDDPKYLLYVVAAKVAHELGVRASPRVPYEELSEQVNTTFPVSPFLGKADQFLSVYFEEEQVDGWTEVPPGSREDAEVEIDVSNIAGAVEWIETGSRNVPRSLANG